MGQRKACELQMFEFQALVSKQKIFWNLLDAPAETVFDSNDILTSFHGLRSLLRKKKTFLHVSNISRF